MILETLHQPLVMLAQGGGSPGAPAPGGGFGIFPFLILMLIMMYFLTIRPQRKKQKELQAQIDALKTGDSVVTVGGMHGLVTNMKDRTVTLKVADNVKIEFEKSSVATVIKKEKPGSTTEIEAEAGAKD